MISIQALPYGSLLEGQNSKSIAVLLLSTRMWLGQHFKLNLLNFLSNAVSPSYAL